MKVGDIVRYHPTPGEEHDGHVYQIWSYSIKYGVAIIENLSQKLDLETGEKLYPKIQTTPENLSLYRNEGLRELRKEIIILRQRASETILATHQHVDIAKTLSMVWDKIDKLQEVEK